MKTVRFLLALALALAAFGAFSRSAAAQGVFSYTSGFQVQNLEGDTANISVKFYDRTTGDLVTTVPTTVPANGSKTFFPLTDVSDGFNGSVVIESDNQVAAISNVHGNNFAANASYVAASSGNTTVSIPLLMKNNSGFNTWFNVQNTGGSDASVDVAYSDGTSVNDVVVKPGAAKTFDQATETHSLAVFSAEVTSTQPVAITVIEESSLLLFAYNGFQGGSTNPVLPLINANNAGFTTGVQIQNAGGTATNVTVSYTPSDGTACEETQSIPAGGSKTFALAAFDNGANSDCVAGAKFVGSAQVTVNSASQPLVAVANQHKLGTNGEAYGGFDSANATDTVVLPLIMDRNSGYWTGFSVMNVGGSSTAVNCTFTGTSYTAGATLAAGEAFTDLQNGAIASGYVGSATCTAGSGGQIVAIVNELGPSGTADQLLVYEGINVTAP